MQAARRNCWKALENGESKLSTVHLGVASRKRCCSWKWLSAVPTTRCHPWHHVRGSEEEFSWDLQHIQKIEMVQENGPCLCFSEKERLTHVESKVELQRKEFSSYRSCIHNTLRVWKKEKSEFVVASVAMGLFSWPCASLCCTTSTRCNFCGGGSVAVPFNTKIPLDFSHWTRSSMLLLFFPSFPLASPGRETPGTSRWAWAELEPHRNIQALPPGWLLEQEQAWRQCLLRDYDVLSLPCLLQAWDETFSAEHVQCRE